ncbi:MAG TPA: prolyl oligopeptidase family serine peptidase [Thermomicrobiaceae bacterium]|nr:prolyl oligopeptidase family serine peptidase [Thermomicrobiaceae bacterium]
MGEARRQPPATRVAPVTDDYHGQAVVDPYRWLEEDASPETRAWVDAQNAYTRSLLDAVPGYERIHRRLAELLAIGTVEAPVVRGGRAFYRRRAGDENQPRLLVREPGAAEDRVLLDPNRESAAGTVALDWWYPSPDGRLLAFGYSEHGDEQSVLQVLDVGQGRLLGERIDRTRFCSLAWLPDASGFYYSRYPHAGEVPPGEERYHRKLFFHRLGDDPRADPLVFGADLAPEDSPSVWLSADGRWLVVTVNHGWARADLYLRDLARPDAGFTPLVVGEDALFRGEVHHGRLYLLTNLDAPRYRLLAVDPERPARANWRELIPEPASGTIEDVAVGRDRLVVQSLVDATSRLARHDLDGQPVGPIDLPGMGTVSRLEAEPESDTVYFGFESFTTPPAVYRADAASGASAAWARVEAPVDLGGYRTEQVWYRSKDGTPVSMFVVAREGTPRDGARPTLLTGYGGFNISRTPAFNRGMVSWLERGGVYALPNLRGGGEYGEEWHRAGMFARKQNVFDDFIAAAEHLVAAGYTSPDRLAIEGGSNGGLLVGAALTQRPDLFRAVACHVPLLDMLRYHHFLIARLWVAEYGSADDPDQFGYLHAYSPYHRVVDGTPYPAVLLLTADSDSRVAPLHARKMTARLQAATSSARPIALRVETEAGHGAGKPVGKLVDEQADVWAFLCRELGVAP